MATTVARLEAVLGADTSAFDRSMDQSESKMHNVRKAAGIAGAAIATGLGVVAKVGFDELRDSQKVTAQTEAALKSTGGAAHVTAKHIDEMAQSILRKTGIDDEQIRSSENLLLTFRGIRNETGKGNKIFDQATKAVTDLSVAFHKDLNSSAILVGKALQDPVKGMSALRRVGVQLDGTQQQLVKDLVEGRNAADAISMTYTGSLSPAQSEAVLKMSKMHAGWREIANTLHLKFTPAQAKANDFMEAGGHTMAAQKIILGELRKETEGSAAAAGKTLAGQLNIARETFKNLAAEIVSAALPAITSFAKIISQATQFLSEHQKVAKVLFIGLGLLAGVLLTISASMKIAAAATKVYAAAQWLLNAAMDANPISLIIIALVALGVAIVVAWKKSETFRDIVIGTWNALKGAATAIFGAIKKTIFAIWDAILFYFKNFTLPGLILSHWNTIKDFTVRIWTAIKDAVVGPASTVLDFFRNNWPIIATLISGPFAPTVALATNAFGIRSALIGAFKAIWKKTGEIVGDVIDLFGNVIDWVKDHWKELAVLLAGPFAPIVAAGTDAFGVRTAIVSTFDSIKNFITDFPNKVTNFISGLKSKIVGWLTSADIGGYFSTTVGGWVSFVTGLPGRVTDFIATLKKKIVGFFTTNAIGDYISSVVGGWVGFITGLPGRVGDFVVALKNKIVGFFIDNDIGGYITSVVSGWIGTIGDLPGKAGAAITAGAKALKKAVTDLFGNVIDWVKKALGISSPSAVFHEMGRQSVQGFINGVGSMAGVLKNAVVGMVKSLPGKALGAVEGAVGAIGGEIKSAPGEHSVGSAEKYLVPWAQQEGITVTSIAGGNHVKGSYHYQHRAIDVDGGYAKNRDFFADSINHFGAKNITELFFDPMGYYIKNGQRIKGAIGGHGDHVHIALDKGGWLPTGTNLITNNTGRPERVLGPGEGGMVVINYNGTIIHEREAEQRIVDLLARAQRRGPLGLSGGFA